MLRLLVRPTHRPYRTLFHHRLDRVPFSGLVSQHPRTMASVASSSQPSVLPNGPQPGLGEEKKQQVKAKKDKVQSAVSSQYPLEVRVIRVTFGNDGRR